MSKVTVFVAALALGFALPALAEQPPSHAPEPATAELTAKVRAVLSNYLKDPDSAMVMVVKGPWHDSAVLFDKHRAGDFLCVRVNARNSYGGYVGYKPYLVVIAQEGDSLAWEMAGTSIPIDEFATSACGA